jgi:DNA-binding GntR family transcriptional regulator
MQSEDLPSNPMSRSVQAAYAYITREIEAGRLAAGQFIREELIAEQVQVSRTPVREALRILAAEGWLEIRKNQGVRVNVWRLEHVKEIFEARTLIEPYLVALAVPNVTRQDIDELTHLAEDMAGNRGGTPDAVTRRQVANDRFHGLLTARADHQVLCAALHKIKKIPLIKWTFRGYSEQERVRSNAQHFDMIDAIRTGDAELAGAIMKSHILHGKHSVLEKLKAEETL